jgi:hypothetical protein
MKTSLQWLVDITKQYNSTENNVLYDHGRIRNTANDISEEISVKNIA